MDMMAQTNGMTMFSIPDLIIKKRDGYELTREEIEFFINGVVSGSVQQAQVGAMLMAMVLKDLSDKETTSLTWAMMNSGEVLKWPAEWQGQLVDKHSTGGVGDKISLVLAPALAACGLKVPMVSGRGLGHTGGTLDKLESIPGFRVNFSNTEMEAILREAGCCIVGQTESLVPADKILYSTRDVTGTVKSVGLISSSIMSKKAAEKLNALILDVKVGNGATIPTEQESRELASRMVKIGNGLGIGTVALLTDMDTPLGHCVGNALEVAESIKCLYGKGPNDIMELIYKLGGHLLYKCKTTSTVEDGTAMIKDKIANGCALQTFCKMIIAQGVDSTLAKSLCDPDTDIWTILPKADNITPVTSGKEGFVTEINAKTCAIVSGNIGAGRKTSDDKIQFGVGLELVATIGEKIEKNDVWIKVHHNSESLPEELVQSLQSALLISDQQPANQKTSRIIDIIP